MATPNSGLLGSFRQFRGNGDLLIAAAVIGIIFIIVIPMSPRVLDVALTFSLSIGVIILLTTMFTEEPLQFSVFPSLLLVVTLLRLALNVASTRLILTTADAGEVIRAFGDFVVRGNYVVGLIIFLIITIIQFIVITNGAGRVAEVAARFTLDAHAGQTNEYRCRLNAGLITDEGQTAAQEAPTGSGFLRCHGRGQ